MGKKIRIHPLQETKATLCHSKVTTAAPKGTPPQRIRVTKNSSEHRFAPPCPGGALRRVTVINIDDFPEKRMNKALKPRTIIAKEIIRDR